MLVAKTYSESPVKHHLLEWSTIYPVAGWLHRTASIMDVAAFFLTGIHTHCGYQYAFPECNVSAQPIIQGLTKCFTYSLCCIKHCFLYRSSLQSKGIVAAGSWISLVLLCSPEATGFIEQWENLWRLITVLGLVVLQSVSCVSISWSLLKLMSIESVMPSNHLIICHPLFLLPSIFPTIRVFSNESALCIRWPKYYSFSFSISPSNEYSGLISFRMIWLDLLAVYRTLKSLLQNRSLKASIFQFSVFFTVHLSHPYMPTGKAIALATWIIVSKVMSLLFSTLSRFVIVFFPMSKQLLFPDPCLMCLLYYRWI